MGKTMDDARLVGITPDGLEVRICTHRGQTWPGWHESVPLGRIGYWVGTARDHRVVPREEIQVEDLVYQEEET